MSVISVWTDKQSQLLLHEITSQGLEFPTAEGSVSQRCEKALTPRCQNEGSDLKLPNGHAGKKRFGILSSQHYKLHSSHQIGEKLF